ncbi:MAG: hypothetical protein R5N68_05835, partial [Cutibacterium granulosum]|nr:hypothetical protein [Cutibacterium granulosum]
MAALGSARGLAPSRYPVSRDLVSSRCFVIRGWFRLDTSSARDQGSGSGQSHRRPDTVGSPSIQNRNG